MIWSVIGNELNKKYFESVIQNRQLVHAYLFTGPEMIGKKMFAYDLARLINNREPDNNPDFTLVGASIEDIRSLKSFLSIKPYYGPYQIGIIDNADRLSTEASNALLKSLEEPSKSAILILITSKLKLLLPTIASRCQEVRFLSPTMEEVEQLIPAQIKSEDKLLLKQLAQNRPGWIIENINSLDEIRTSIQNFNKVLGQGIFEKIQFASKIHDKEDLPDQINNLIHYFYSQENKSPQLLKCLTVLANTISQSQFNRRLALENLLININAVIY